ncbi:MAG: hypothetical protein NTW87_34465 [Planctomycetota bacterium]|nr:hypothetical protein [Planctomycetota bacterium]
MPDVDATVSGKTTDCLADDASKKVWRVQDGALVTVPGTPGGVLTTGMEFGDGDIRVRYEVRGVGYGEFNARYSPLGYVQASMDRPQMEAKKGVQEFIFHCRGDDITATLNGQLWPLNGKPKSGKGRLRFCFNGGTLRVVSIDYRDLAPERLEVGQKDKDGWTCIFNGRDLTGWTTVGAAPKVEEGAIAFVSSRGISRSVAMPDFEAKGSLLLRSADAAGYFGSIAVRQPDLQHPGESYFGFYRDGTMRLFGTAQGTVVSSGSKVAIGTWQRFLLRVVGDTASLDVEGANVFRVKLSRLEGGPLFLHTYGMDGRAIAFKDLWLRELGPDGKPLGAAPKP